MAKVIRIGERVQHTGSGILELVEAYHIGRLKRYKKGSALYWQGDLAKYVFVVKRGKVKVFSISLEGKAHTYDILGAGRLVGVTALLLGGEYESMAEALDDTDVYIIPQAEFEHLLASNPLFSIAVMRELAQTVRLLVSQVQDLSFLDVHQRLRDCLVRLAEEHGVISKEGIRIDFGITHQEIAELIGAHRSTVTSYLTKLRQEGLLWKQGRRLLLIPFEHIEILDSLSQSVIEGNEQKAISWARQAVEERVDPVKALDALASGMRQVDKGFAQEELALPDVLMAALAMKKAVSIIGEEMERAGNRVPHLATVVIGTVKGDIHDIGKTMVEAMFVAAGFNVVDIGVDKPPSVFAEAAERNRADIIGASALMSTTRPGWMDITEYFKALGIRDKYKIMVGGGGEYTRGYAEEVGADGFGKDAAEAVEVAKKLMGIVG